jgi:hypothetical protein
MIEITELCPADVGRWVTYSILEPHAELGRIEAGGATNESSEAL